jgi:lipopolysaccharide transport system ATP-binding protein
LYWTYQTDQSKEKWPTLHKGKNVLRSLLPKRLLNEGTYSIEIIASIHYKEWIAKNGDGIGRTTFQIIGGLSDSPIWQEKRPGLLAPNIYWEQLKT